jgi:hypothetical protein
MRKQPHREHAPGRVGRLRGRVRHAVIAIACVVLACPTPALAEVCDKVVGVDWRRSHGAMWTVTFPSTDWKALLILGLIALSIPCALALVTLASRLSWGAATVLKWVGYVLTALVILVAFVYLHGLVFLQDMDAILAQAGREGCIVFHHDWRGILIHSGVIALVALGYVGVAMRLRRFEHTIAARHQQLVTT